jgi:hypothetical protein
MAGYTSIVGQDGVTPARVTALGAFAVDPNGVAPDPNNILSGTVTRTDTTSSGTLITIPAGRTWVGEVVVSIASTAAAIVAATVTTAGTNAVPAAGTVVARVNVGGLTSGCFTAQATFSVRAVAPAGNTISLFLINTSATANTSSATANGILI